MPSAASSPVRPRSGPVVAAGTLIGLGMGGFIDGILLHQVLQWHQMISARLPPVTLEAKNVNMFWDGVFHAITWTLTAAGVAMLWRLVGRADVLRSTPLLLAAILFGWGLFNVLDSLINHYLFRLHNVREVTSNPALWNAGFLALGAAQAAAGWLVIRRVRAGRP